MQARIDGRRLSLTRGDITAVEADAIVNAANQHLSSGGGVDGAIHRRGGSEILAECRRIGGCATGDAVVTTGGHLPAKYVIHAVAPRWRGGNSGEPDLLESAYRRSMEVAAELGCRSVAFPSLGTGAYGYPVRQAAEVALSSVHRYLSEDTEVEEVIFVLFSDADLQIYRQVMARLMADHEKA